jgi:protein-tyrosine phosphatase
MPKLMSVEDMPKVNGVKIPWDMYVVMDQPLLAGMCYPYSGTPWDSLEKAGFSGIVCLCDRHPDYDPYPLRILYATKLADLYMGNLPRYPLREEKHVREAVKCVVKAIDAGEGVIVHCLGGIGRTGTVIGCVLREFGFSADEAIGYLDEINIDRRIGPWSDSEWQAEMVRKY